MIAARGCKASARIITCRFAGRAIRGNEEIWRLRDDRLLSLRAIASETLEPFRKKISQLGDDATLRQIEAVLEGEARSLLDFPDRPKSYEDAGQDLDWNRRRVRRWPQSAYEKSDSSRDCA